MEYEILNIRKTIENEGKAVLQINIKYPVFTELEAADKINSFYLDIANGFCDYAEKTSAKKAVTALSAEPEQRPFGEIILPKIVTDDEGKYISVILDVTSYDGIFARERRISQVWNTDTGLLCEYKSVLPLSKKRILSLIAEQIDRELLSNDIHDYYIDCKRLCKKHFSVRNFFVTKRGIVFYYQSGLLCPQNEGIVCFTIERDITLNSKKADSLSQAENGCRE